jgi:hypothetical protein
MPSVGWMKRRVTAIDLLIAVSLVAAVVVFLGHGHAHRTNAILADPVRTPGVVNPNVTAYTDALKIKQMKQYGETGSPSDYQEDHLISLEMGGNPTDPRNLWPEPYPRAAQMDQIENQLNSEICDGTLTLAQARDKEDTIKHTQG